MTPTTETTESVRVDMLAEIRQAQLAQADDLKVIKGQLADLPEISNRLASTRLDLRHDVGALREQAAELPGIRTRLEEQDRQLVEIKEQLATIIGMLAGGTGGVTGDVAG